MKKIKQLQGFTLAELMVAIALGILLSSITIAIYLGAKSSFRATNAVSRSQESSRFALGFLTQGINVAGYSLCAGNTDLQRNFLNEASNFYSPSIKEGIFGWEYNGTDIGDDFQLNYTEVNSEVANTDADIEAIRNANAAGAGAWDGGLPAALAGLNPMLGSDILAISFSKPFNDNNLFIDDYLNRRIATFNLADSNGSPVASGINNGQIIKIGDCSALDIFQNTAGVNDAFISMTGGNAGSLNPGNNVTASFRSQKAWQGTTLISTIETRVFFIGTGAGGIPSLFMFNSDCALDVACPGAAAVELVEGVENLQLLYGEDTNGNDNIPDRFVSADNVNDFSDVSTVKLGLLVRSVTDGKDTIDQDSYDLIDNITITPPANQLLRYVNNTTVKLQNRGL